MKGADPFELFKLHRDSWLALYEAQSVVAMRMMGMAGLWNTTAQEMSKMMSEKPEAFGRSATAVGLAMLTGERPSRIMRKGLDPVARTARNNRKRLRKRGPASFV